MTAPIPSPTPSSSGRPPRRPSRLAEHPHPASGSADPAPAEQPDPPATGDDALPMPPRRRRGEVRVQLNTRIPQSTRGRTDEFVREHDAALQDVVETALTEYLDRRGAPPWTGDR